MTIKAKHPVRNEFADCSTGSDRGYYYSSKSLAINAFDGVLQGHDLCLDRNYIADWSGNEGRVNHPVVDEFGHEHGCAIFTYYRMQSGNYEVIGYIA